MEYTRPSCHELSAIMVSAVPSMMLNFERDQWYEQAVDIDVRPEPRLGRVAASNTYTHLRLAEGMDKPKRNKDW